MPQNEQVLVETADCTLTNGACPGTGQHVSIARYNVASGAQLPSIAVHTTGSPSAPSSGVSASPLFASADDSIFITPFSTMSEIDHLNGTYSTVQYAFQSMSTDLTTLDALDPASTSNHKIFDTFRTPFTGIFQRGTAESQGGYYGKLNRDGSVATGWGAYNSTFFTGNESIMIPGVDKEHDVDFGASQCMFLGPDAVDGNHNLYYFFLWNCGGNSNVYRIGIENLSNFTYAGYLNVSQPASFNDEISVSQVNGDLYVASGSHIYVFNVPSCGCGRTQRTLPLYFKDASVVADRSGQYLIVYGHPATNPNEEDVIGVNPQSGVIEHTYAKIVSPSGHAVSITAVLAQ